MIYHKQTKKEEHAKSESGGASRYTEAGTVTLLFRQPVLVPSSRRGWEMAQPGTITINFVNTTSHITGAWFKSLVHYTVAPPDGQHTNDRTGQLYFTRSYNDTVLDLNVEPPVLKPYFP